MTEPDFQIPADSLPEGFAENVDRPPDSPVAPRPAATVVLLRPSDRGPEVLLLRRNRTVGFVPGAYVFPGGRVETDDAAPEVLAHVQGLSVEQAAGRLRLYDEAPSAIAYYVAAIREAFEETGILVASDSAGEPAASAAASPDTRAAQIQLHRGERTFGEILATLDVTLSGGAIEYIAHWITPRAEPRRYDTRFFAVLVPAGEEARPDGSEITEARWLPPEIALELHAEGDLPMVFPTIKTLGTLSGFESVDALMASFAGRPIPAILPRLVRTPTGVGIEIPEEGPPPPP
jgi:8-oxo-dGTP pyrophosphatase MutT (NUDIX family)